MSRTIDRATAERIIGEDMTGVDDYSVSSYVTETLREDSDEPEKITVSVAGPGLFLITE